MALLASSIISRARVQLIDPDGTRWSDADLLKWLSDGQRTIVAMAPGAASTYATVQLAAGTLQTIPADGHMLLYITRNMGTDRATPGRAVRVASRDTLDAFNPDWHTDAAKDGVQEYVFNTTQSLNFYVYPPNTGLGSVEMVYALLPQELTALTDTLVVQPIYQTALFDYLMFRAHQLDSDFAAGAAVSQSYLQLFLAYMQTGDQSQDSSSPTTALAATNFGPRQGASP